MPTCTIKTVNVNERGFDLTIETDLDCLDGSGKKTFSITVDRAQLTKSLTDSLSKDSGDYVKSLVMAKYMEFQKARDIAKSLPDTTIEW
jgi:hypothetical protein